MRRERPEAEPKRDYCNFLASYLDAVYELPTLEEQAGALFALLEYMIYDREPVELSGGAAILFKMARPVIDRTIRRQTANRLNGLKPKRSQDEANKKPTRSESKQEKEMDKEEDEGIKGIRREENARAESAPLPTVRNQETIEWLAYREDQGKPLTEKQINLIDRQIDNAIREYGRRAVSDLVSTCIASGYKEIFFDRLSRQKKELRGFDALIAMEQEVQLSK